MITSAQATTTNPNAEIQNLLTQIKALQEQLKTLRDSIASTTHPGQQIAGFVRDWSNGSSTMIIPRIKFSEGTSDDMPGAGMMNRGSKVPECAAFSRSLMMGSRGDDVRNLQGVLHAHDLIASSSQTGFFGAQTAAALAKFQAKFGIASSTASSTPVAGPMTRGFLQKLCVQRAQTNMGDDMRNGSSTPPAWGRSDMPKKPEWNMPTTTRPIPPHPCTPGRTESPIPCPADDQNSR